jgi:hypothetical protein
MAEYGVVPTGFDRKQLPTILTEIEAAMVTEFGPKVIQTSQSPFGQINGLMADLIATLWEFAEDVYQSYDVDQAEGNRLDILGKLRLIERSVGEGDAAYRKAITNAGQARIDIQDITRSMLNVDGVTYAHTFVNDTATTDPQTGLPGGSLAVAVIGGDNAALGAALRPYVVPGISTYGNQYVSTDIEGYCRTFTILRPIVVPIKLNITVRMRRDIMGCPPPAVVSLKAAIVDALSPGGSHELLNGDDITHFKIRSVVESLFPSVEVISISAKREDWPYNVVVPITFNELATLRVEDIEVEVVP